jgi:hypothetical protein
MDDKPLSPHKSFRLTPFSRLPIGDLVALATTACLVSTVFFLQYKVLPTFAVMMAAGGYPVPFPPAASWVFKLTVSYVLPAFICWVLYAAWRQGRTPHAAFRWPRMLAAVNVVAVVFLMAQASVFVGFAKQAPRLVHRVITAQEQAQAKPVVQPASFRQR